MQISKIDPTCASLPAAHFGGMFEAQIALRFVSGDKHSSALANQVRLSRILSRMSVMALTG